MIAYRKPLSGVPKFWRVSGKAELCHLDLYPVHKSFCCIAPKMFSGPSKC